MIGITGKFIKINKDRLTGASALEAGRFQDWLIAPDKDLALLSGTGGEAEG